MTREDAIKKLKNLHNSDDPEMAHSKADQIIVELLSSLGYRDVAEAWDEVEKWYA